MKHRVLGEECPERDGKKLDLSKGFFAAFGDGGDQYG